MAKSDPLDKTIELLYTFYSVRSYQTYQIEPDPGAESCENHARQRWQISPAVGKEAHRWPEAFASP